MRLQDVRLLLVEDDDLLRTMMGDYLESLGCEVHLAEDGHRALEFLSARGAGLDLLITDAQLPEHDGGEIALAAREVSASCRVLFASGYPEQVAIRRGIITPGEAFLKKPLRLKALGEFLARLLADPKSPNPEGSTPNTPE